LPTSSSRIVAAPAVELNRRHEVFLARNNNRRERTVLLRIDGFDVIAIPQPSHASDSTASEHEWKTLKAHHLARGTFKNAASLRAAIDEEIKAMNQNRQRRSLAKPKISA